MSNQQRTVRELTPAIGAEVNVRFESPVIRCTVLDAKSAWGKVRLEVAPMSGTGAQWVELERLVATTQAELGAALKCSDIN